MPFHRTRCHSSSHRGRSWAHRLHRSCQVGRVDRLHIANPRQNSLVKSATLKLVAPAEAGHNREVLLFPNLGRIENRAHARRVGGHRFLDKAVFASLNYRAKCNGRKPGCRENHHVHPAVDQLLVGIQITNWCGTSLFSCCFLRMLLRSTLSGKTSATAVNSRCYRPTAPG